MNDKSTYLPSMSIADLDKFCSKIRNDNIKDLTSKGTSRSTEDLSKLHDMANLVYDHDKTYTNALKHIKESSLGTMFKPTKLTVPEIEAETKVKDGTMRAKAEEEIQDSALPEKAKQDMLEKLAGCM